MNKHFVIIVFLQFQTFRDWFFSQLPRAQMCASGNLKRFGAQPIKADFVGNFSGLSGKRLCLSVNREVSNAKQ